ncbi:CcmD family protein [Clostridium botulinum]
MGVYSCIWIGIFFYIYYSKRKFGQY